MIHVLWECPATMDVWGCSKHIFQKGVTESRNFLQLAESMMARCGKDEVVTFVRLARKLWHRRNLWVHERRFTHPTVLVQETQ